MKINWLIEFDALKTPAIWTSDCQWKQDFDWDLVKVNTRYYPDYTAYSTIDIHHWIITEEDTEWSYLTLTEKKFSSDSELEVKKQVEEWVQNEFAKIQMYLVWLYKIPEIEWFTK